MEDILINFGSEIKALPNGHIGGHLVRFTDKNSPDLAGDYFDADTDFGFDSEIKSPVYLNHRMPLETSNGKRVVVKERIGTATLKKADDGILIDAILYERKKYAKALAEMGWSSGTANHLVDRSKKGNAFHVDCWPLGLDSSLTPNPCDPANVCSLKSYSESLKTMIVDVVDDSEEVVTKTFAPNSLAAVLNKHIDDRVDDGHSRDSIIKSLVRESGLDDAAVNSILGDEAQASNANLKAFARVLAVSVDSLKSARRRDHARTIKGMFEEALADNVPSRWQLDSVYCDIMRKVAATAQASSVTGVDFDVAAKIKEATGEYMARLETLAVTQVNDYVESGSDEPFYLKAIVDAKDGLLVSNGIDFDDHSELVVSAFQELSKRFRANADARKSQKAGRVLSDKNRQRLSTLVQQIKQAVSDCEGLLEETKPMASDEAMRAAQTRHLALRTERRVNQLGV